MADKDDIEEGEEPGLDDMTSRLAAETPGADDAAEASDKLRNDNDPDNASSETS
jgi:hypothetical protein